jgi:lipoate-protein ligase B
VPYGAALELQRKAVEARQQGCAGDRLLLLEHTPVVTLGRSSDPAHLRTPAESLRARGIEVREVARGGDVTYHGPGQLVGYLIVDLAARDRRDAHAFLRDTEAALIGALAGLGIEGAQQAGRTGVFVAGTAPPRKIASIGIGLRRWVTWHGFALNVTNDLGEFDDIVPCGLHDVEMTSVARELGGARPGLDAAVRGRVASAFRSAFP